MSNSLHWTEAAAPSRSYLAVSVLSMKWNKEWWEFECILWTTKCYCIPIISLIGIFFHFTFLPNKYRKSQTLLMFLTSFDNYFIFPGFRLNQCCSLVFANTMLCRSVMLCWNQCCYCWLQSNFHLSSPHPTDPELIMLACWRHSPCAQNMSGMDWTGMIHLAGNEKIGHADFTNSETELEIGAGR